MRLLSVLFLGCLLASCGPTVHRIVENKTDAERQQWLAAQPTDILCGGYTRPWLQPKTRVGIEAELARRGIDRCGSVIVGKPVVAAAASPNTQGTAISVGQSSNPQEGQTDEQLLAAYQANWRGSRGVSAYSRDQSALRSADIMDCGDFSSSAQAQAHFLRAGGPQYDPHNLDRDGDGLACEWGTGTRPAAPRTVATGIRPRYSGSKCYVGPRGGTYTITASGRKNYDGC